MKETVIKWLEDNRGLIIFIFCLPASLLFDLVLKIRKWVFKTIFSSPNYHDERVKSIQKQIRNWNDLPQKERKLLCNSRPNWLSLSLSFFRKDLCHKIPIPLYDILEFDEKNLTVRVEPMVTVEDILNYLVPKGYKLAVTVEMFDATLGGLTMAAAVTANSHKVGLMQETVIKYEIVLSDGSLVEATEDNEHSDLYYALPWSHGSLGFLVGLTLKVKPVKPYVKLTYTPVRGLENYCDKFRELCGATGSNNDIPDYVEATIFSKNSAIIMTGNFSDYDPTLSTNYLTKWYKPWFYKYVEKFIESGEYTELVPLREYLLRHNRALFWAVESMIPYGNNPLFRLFFGWLLPPKPAFLKFTTTPGIRAYTFTKQVFQDMMFPINELEYQIKMSDKLFDMYPLLVYPARIYDRGSHSGQLKQPKKEHILPGKNYAMYCDLGIYGVPGYIKNKKDFNAVTAMREMEKSVRDKGGVSYLYADIFMTFDEFKQTYDLTLYEQVREKYGANNAFPHLYDKVKPEIDVFKIGKY